MLVLSVGQLAAQTVKTIRSFNGTDGSAPVRVLLTQGRDGKLYGTTAIGGTNGSGTIFKQRTVGTASVVLYNFTGPDPVFPQGGLILARDGNYYGTTSSGGSAGIGTLYRINSAGKLTVLYSFTGAGDGAFPNGSPIEAFDGNLYGTTNGSTSQNSTVYRFTPSGTFSTIYTFDSASGYAPAAPLLQATDGTLYATTTSGGASGAGSIVQLTTAGTLVNKHGFDSSIEGAVPLAPLIQASDGNFYGTANSGGAHGGGTVFRLGTDWTFTVLHSFASILNDGSDPAFGLTQGTDGNLYGGTAGGGTDSAGSLFQVSLSGTYVQLYSFPATQKAPLQEPNTPVQYTGGIFYGVTQAGGANGLGSVYTLDMGLGPFIAFVRAQGKVGTKAQILGQGFTEATSVTFNGVPATSFNIVRDTYMTAVVPDGSTTGPVVVKTPTGSLTSNVSFRVSK